MKKLLLVLLFLSITIGITLTSVNVKKDDARVDIKLQNIEALAADEGGTITPTCSLPGGMCMIYGTDGNPIFYPGLTLGN